MLVGLLGVSTACLAAPPDGQGTPAPAQTPSSAAAAPPAAAMTQGRIAVCVVADSAAPLTREFSLRLSEPGAASGTVRLVPAGAVAKIALMVSSSSRTK